jgi:hypothetical protein
MEGRGRESAKKYLRGVLGVERETSSYIVREEGKMNRLRVMDGREECRMLEKKKHGEGEKEIVLIEKRVCQ